MLSRAEADALLSEYDELGMEYRITVKMVQDDALISIAFAKANACRERILDALSGEEGTQPLAGRAR